MKSVRRAAERMASRLDAISTELLEPLTDRGRVSLEMERRTIGWELQRYVGALMSPDEAATAALRHLYEGAQTF
jgi:hypothetical protein